MVFQKGDDPFVIIDKNESLPVEKRFTGFCIDIVRKLASPDYMNFNYTIQIQSGTGGVNENTSRWNGIIGDLIDQVWLSTYTGHTRTDAFDILIRTL